MECAGHEGRVDRPFVSGLCLFRACVLYIGYSVRDRHTLDGNTERASIPQYFSSEKSGRVLSVKPLRNNAVRETDTDSRGKCWPDPDCGREQNVQSCLQTELIISRGQLLEHVNITGS